MKIRAFFYPIDYDFLQVKVMATRTNLNVDSQIDSNFQNLVTQLENTSNEDYILKFGEEKEIQIGIFALEKKVCDIFEKPEISWNFDLLSTKKESINNITCLTANPYLVVAYRVNNVAKLSCLTTSAYSSTEVETTSYLKPTENSWNFVSIGQKDWFFLSLTDQTTDKNILFEAFKLA